VQFSGSLKQEQKPTEEKSRWRRIVTVAINGVEHRAALASLEFSELKRDLALSGALVLTASFATLLAGTAALLLVAAIYWDTEHRVSAMAIALAVLATLAVGCLAAAWRFVSRLQILPAVREQLKKDRTCLGTILSD
jgi:uncharacterized membrane protein YqjE